MNTEQETNLFPKWPEEIKNICNAYEQSNVSITTIRAHLMEHFTKSGTEFSGNYVRDLADRIFLYGATQLSLNERAAMKAKTKGDTK